MLLKLAVASFAAGLCLCVINQAYSIQLSKSYLNETKDSGQGDCALTALNYTEVGAIVLGLLFSMIFVFVSL